MKDTSKTEKLSNIHSFIHSKKKYVFTKYPCARLPAAPKPKLPNEARALLPRMHANTSVH